MVTPDLVNGGSVHGLSKCTQEDSLPHRFPILLIGQVGGIDSGATAKIYMRSNDEEKEVGTYPSLRNA